MASISNVRILDLRRSLVLVGLALACFLSLATFSAHAYACDVGSYTDPVTGNTVITQLDSSGGCGSTVTDSSGSTIGQVYTDASGNTAMNNGQCSDPSSPGCVQSYTPISDPTVTAVVVNNTGSPGTPPAGTQSVTIVDNTTNQPTSAVTCQGACSNGDTSNVLITSSYTTTPSTPSQATPAVATQSTVWDGGQPVSYSQTDTSGQTTSGTISNGTVTSSITLSPVSLSSISGQINPGVLNFFQGNGITTTAYQGSDGSISIQYCQNGTCATWYQQGNGGQGGGTTTQNNTVPTTPGTGTTGTTGTTGGGGGGGGSNGGGGGSNGGNGGGNSGPSCSFSASPTTVDTGSPITLTWSCQNVSSCTEVSNSDGFTTGGRASGSSSATPSSSGSKIYAMTCGGYTVYSNAVSAISPQVSITASPPLVAAGKSTTIAWTAQNVSSCSVSGPGVSSASTHGQQSIPVSNQAVYKIVCQTLASPITGSVTVNVVPTFNEF